MTCLATRRDGTRCPNSAGSYGYCGVHDRLTDKQRAFIDEYLIDYNATQASIRAGYSEQSAYSIGWENLRKPEIRRVLDARIEERAMGAEEALARLGAIARSSIAPFIQVRTVTLEDGRQVEVAGVDLTTEEAARNFHLVKKLRPTPDGYEVTLHDAQAALVEILKVLGMYRERVEHSVDEASAGEIARMLGVSLSGIHGNDEGDG